MNLLRSKVRLALGQRNLMMLIVFLTASGLGLIRTWNSLDQLPPDPSVDFYLESRFNGWMTLFRIEGGYLDVPRRLLAIAISFLPPEVWVLASNAIWVVMMGTLAVLLYREAREGNYGPFPTAFLTIAPVLAPAAAESQLGHDSVIKWPLLMLAVIVWANRPDVKDLRKDHFLILVLTGLSNPLYPILFLAVLLSSRWKSRVDFNLRIARVTILALPVVAQVGAWQISSQPLHKYGSSAIRKPWDGMGGFWWVNWLWSPAMTVVLVVTILVLRSREHSRIRLQVRVALFAIALWVACYYVGGIGDRYFVVPQVLGTLSVVLILREPDCLWSKQPLRILQSLTGIGVLLLYLAASLQWFTPSAFLTSSERWSVSAQRARTVCDQTKTEVTPIPQSMNTIDFPCVIFSLEK